MIAKEFVREFIRTVIPKRTAKQIGNQQAKQKQAK